MNLEETDTEWRGMARVTDLERNFSVIGAASQPKMLTLTGGRKVPDNFARTKCVSKTQRNALRIIIPETFIKTMIGRFIEMKKEEVKARKRGK